MKRFSLAHTRQGFTLIELAVVLVVIGILVGGIVAGQNLLRVQRVRSVASNATHYVMAAQEFSKQYGYLPGDFPNAVKIWGRADGGTDLTTNCASPNDDASTANATCNGDGNGFINNNYERYRAWQHLGLAGMVNGSYTGIGNGASSPPPSPPPSPAPTLGASDPGINVPTDSIDGSIYTFANAIECIVCASATYEFDGDYTGALFYGAAASSDVAASPDGSGAILSGKEIYDLDNKFDDAAPSTGNIRTWKNTVTTSSGNANCTMTSSGTTVYKRSLGTQPICAPIFMNTYKADKSAS